MSARDFEGEIPDVKAERVSDVMLVVVTTTRWDARRGEAVSEPEYLDPDEAEAFAAALLRAAARARNHNDSRPKRT